MANDTWNISIKECSLFPDLTFEDKRNVNIYRVISDPDAEKVILKTTNWHKTVDRPNVSDQQSMQAQYKDAFYCVFLFKESEKIDHIAVSNDITVTTEDGEIIPCKLTEDGVTYSRLEPQYIYKVVLRFYKIVSDALSISSFLSSDYVLAKYGASALNYLTFTASAIKAEHLGSENVASAVTATSQQFEIGTDINSSRTVTFAVPNPADIDQLKTNIENAFISVGMTGIDVVIIGKSIKLQRNQAGSARDFTLAQTAPGTSDALAFMGWLAGTYTGQDAINTEFSGLAPVTFYTLLEPKEDPPELSLIDEDINGEELPRYAGSQFISRKRITFCLTAEQLRILHYVFMCDNSDIDLYLKTTDTTLNPIHKRDLVEIQENEIAIDLYEVDLVFPYESVLQQNYFSQ